MDSVAFLQKYLRINTVYPSPNYQSVVDLFKYQALADRFLVQDIVLPSGNPVLVITLRGSSEELPALALNHHMDVVPVDNEQEWKFPPFEGVIDDDYIYGRGTQDCKGLGVAHYAALQRFAQESIQPKRTIHCIIVPDEERGGFEGTKQFVAHPIFKSLNIGYVLDEGMPSGDESVMLIKIDERTPVQIKITARAAQAHASQLFHNNCVHNLVTCLNDIVVLHEENKLMAEKNSPGKQLSLQITGLNTCNSAFNVIPSCAQAIVDIRVPSVISIKEVTGVIDRLIAKYTAISYEILATSRERLRPVSIDSSFYTMLAKVIKSHHFVPKPFSFEATTDGRFYSDKGIEVIGFTPFTVPSCLHGTDEYVRVKDVQQATILLQGFLKEFCM
jgi:aminoacylase